MVLNSRKAHGNLNPTGVVMWLGVNGRDAPQTAVVQDQARDVAHCPTAESLLERHAPDALRERRDGVEGEDGGNRQE